MPGRHAMRVLEILGLAKFLGRISSAFRIACSATLDLSTGNANFENSTEHTVTDSADKV